MEIYATVILPDGYRQNCASEQARRRGGEGCRKEREGLTANYQDVCMSDRPLHTHPSFNEFFTKGRCFALGIGRATAPVSRAHQGHRLGIHTYTLTHKYTDTYRHTG